MDYSLSDIASVAGERGGGFGGLLMVVIVFLFVVMLGGRGFGGSPDPGYVTQADLAAGLNNVTVNGQLQGIALSSANNNYETARLVNEQTNALMQQNNTNLINAIQGFNAVTQGLQNQTNVLGQQIMALSAKMDDCCCSIKTQLLQNRLDDAQAALVAEKGKISNYDQTQYILSTMGKWVANPAATA